LLDDCKIIKAYPYEFKPTRLSKAVIAVSQSEVEVENIAIGDECYFGNYTINTAVYVPYEFGVPAVSKFIDAIVKSQADYCPLKISTTKIENVENISCFKFDCSFTFNDFILMEDENE
jgi:hypothetical protein